MDSKSNPADYTSRGICVDDLLNFVKWVSDPLFLRASEHGWPRLPYDVRQCNQAGDSELKRTILPCEVLVP